MAPPSDSAASVAEAAPAVASPRLRAALRDRLLSTRFLAVVIVGCEMVALAVFSVGAVQRLITREDEVLALFVGRSSFGDALHQVVAERGGAPLHFAVAWVIVHLGGHLVALRLASTAFAVASLPLIALLGTRIARDVRVGVVAALLAAPSWMFLYYASFGRMYAMFLFFATLAPLLLLRALDRERRRDWAFWWIGSLLVLASHPYGLFVLGAGIATVLVARRPKPRTWLICAVPIVAALPFWVGDFVLRSRFEVGVGGGGESLGSPGKVASFLLTSFQDAFSARGWAFRLAALLFVAGIVVVARSTGKTERALLAASFALPLAALLAVRAGGTVAPETRHLIFLLPFADIFVASALVYCLPRLDRAGIPVLVLAVALLGRGALHAADEHTNSIDLFHGDLTTRTADRAEAAAWIGAHVSRSPVLLGYDPIYYRVWVEHPDFSSSVVARADGRVAAKQLTRYCGKFHGAIFTFDTTNYYWPGPRPNIPRLLARLHAHGYTTRQFGDFLLVVSPRTAGTPRDYIRAAEPVLRAGKAEALVTADVALTSVLIARNELPADTSC